MRIEIECSDIFAAYVLAETPLPDGAKWEELPPIALANDNEPIQAGEFVAKVVIAVLEVTRDVSIIMLGQILADAMTKNREEKNAKPPKVCINGEDTECNKEAITERIRKINKAMGK